MGRKNIIWTTIFGLSCSFGIIFSILGLREHILHPFTVICSSYIILTLVLLALAVFSRLRMDI